MIKMKLEALEHPNPDSINIDDRKSFATTVLWLEDQKIRQYKVEERAGLRNFDNRDVWEKAYQKYKDDLGVPKLELPIEELTWLLGYAVKLEYLDAPQSYKNITAKEIKELGSKSQAPTIKAENVFDNIDFQDKDFVSGVRAMAKMLGVAHHPDHLIQLEAIGRIVHNHLPQQSSKTAPLTGTPFPYEQGNDVVTDDGAIDQAIRALRLLQIQSLRKLQTSINETIVRIQDLTANPKTDSKLGKVGF